LTDELDSFAKSALGSGGLDFFGLFLGQLEFGGRMSLILTDGDDGGMYFCHISIYNYININNQFN
jgi:hypothetical protein